MLTDEVVERAARALTDHAFAYRGMPPICDAEWAELRQGCCDGMRAALRSIEEWVREVSQADPIAREALHKALRPPMMMGAGRGKLVDVNHLRPGSITRWGQ